jgi:hypothetical protein
MVELPEVTETGGEIPRSDEDPIDALHGADGLEGVEVSIWRSR